MAMSISLGIKVRAMTGSAYLSSVLCHTPTAAQQVDWLTSFGHSDNILQLYFW
jgi:hypothetical protein